MWLVTMKSLLSPYPIVVGEGDGVGGVLPGLLGPGHSRAVPPPQDPAPQPQVLSQLSPHHLTVANNIC
jgi:hypothetical protein